MVFNRQPKMIKMKYKDNFLEKSLRPSRWNFCTTKFFEFCKRTDLHGFKYIAMEELSVAERSVWGVAVMISVICAATVVIIAYKWYSRNSIVTVVESTQGAIWDIPFPAVTVCDLNMVSKRAARAFANNLTLPENVTSDFVFKTLKIAPLLHSSTITDAIQKGQLYKLQDVLDLNNISLDYLFRQISPATDCNKLVERCMWKNTIFGCDQIFQHIFTGTNLCCTFNYYGVDDLLNEMKLLRFPTPRRVASCGYDAALTLILRTDPDDYYSTSFASRGTLIFIDNAYNVLDPDSPVRILNPDTEIMIAVAPEKTYTMPGIRSFPIHERECLYNDELKIANFHQYSFHNCMLLQKIQLLINNCDCIPFYFPQKDISRPCNFHDIECLESVISPNYFSQDESDGSDASRENMIKCMPECEHIDYPIEVAFGRLSVRLPHNATSFFDELNLENRSVVNVFFNDLVATRYRRDAFYNWQNILAAFGGLLSLMLGFTLISGFDFVLFFSLRVLYDSISRFFIDNPNEIRTSEFTINVEEYKKENWAIKAKKYEDAAKTYDNIAQMKIRY